MTGRLFTSIVLIVVREGRTLVVTDRGERA